MRSRNHRNDSQSQFDENEKRRILKLVIYSEVNLRTKLDHSACHTRYRHAIRLPLSLSTATFVSSLLASIRLHISGRNATARMALCSYNVSDAIDYPNSHKTLSAGGKGLVLPR